MKRLAMLPLVGLLAAAACTVDKPTAPFSELTAGPGTGISASVAGGSGNLDFNTDLDRIADLVSAFDNVEAGQRFQGHLDELRTRLNAGDVAQASLVLDQARQEMTGLNSHGDRGYVEMVFRSIDEALAQ